MRKWALAIAMILVPFLSGFYAWQAMARLHYLNSPAIEIQTQSARPFELTWPDQGRAAVGLVGVDSCRVSGDTEAFPTASIAKIITALVILDKFPLTSGEDGPILTMTTDDVARLIETQQQSGSYTLVSVRQQISQRQILEAIMLASANNLADSLAIWAFGSIEGYRAAAQAWLIENGLSSITIGADASGLDAGTRATSSDLCRLMMIALKNSVLTEIMGAREANFAGELLQNTNKLLGSHGVFAGKTGFTYEAGAGILLATNIEVGGKSQTVIVAVLGQENYNAVYAATEQLLASLSENLTLHQLAKAGQKIGAIDSPWGEQTDLVASRDFDVVTWADQSPNYSISLNATNLSSLKAGEKIGAINAASQSVDIIAKDDLSAPSVVWRMTHGFW